MIELLGKDNMKLSSKQVADIMNAIKHEDLIEKEEKEQKRLEKLAEAQPEEMDTAKEEEELKDTAQSLDTAQKLGEKPSPTDSQKKEASQKQ